MESSSKIEDSTVKTLVADLREPAETPDRARASVEVALRHSARASAGDRENDASYRLDEAALRALDSMAAVDPVLDNLDLGLLAGLLDRCAARLPGNAPNDPAVPPARRVAWMALDVVRRSAVLRRIPPADRQIWATRILGVIDASHFTVGPLLVQRAERYGSRPLFQIPRTGGTRALSWRQVLARVSHFLSALRALDPDEGPGPVAILAENRIETALLDLACLSGGVEDVLIPANSTESDVAYMLKHSAARTAVVSDRRQLRKVLACRDSLPELRHVIVVDSRGVNDDSALTWSAFLSAADRLPDPASQELFYGVGSHDLATIMYTSGTTGSPKGIRFSQRNLVFKRFARALALPELGDQDVFLCFLPLYHTFGRFFEMLGCIFWGATYCFLDNPSVDSLVRGMRRYRPTAFISVPKKWIQLHDAIVRRANPETASDEELRQTTRQITGGNLRWGLSAAGHLDPDIFGFFQHLGVDLVSGFGMTEATGGITMTSPGGYRPDSIGQALPGIELRLADDGELLVRGAYVMIGYHAPPDGEMGFDSEGWFHSGDIMEVDADGHLRLIDRKKEIYKNIKGETIAPQRVENLFRDLESVGRAFVVGDHLEYNTVLLYPNPDYVELDLGAMNQDALRDHFRSLVVSVNRFLAPYERIVDFAIIDRDLDAEHGELTPKGTPRRMVVARNFAETIRSLYRQTVVRVGDVELTLPNWLFQVLGLTAQDLSVEADRIALTAAGTGLSVESLEEGVSRIGSCVYRHPEGPVDLGALLNTPRLWLGNEQLVEFTDLDASQRQRPGRGGKKIRWLGRHEPFRPSGSDRERFAATARMTRWDLLDVDRAARFIGAEYDDDALESVRVLARILDEAEGPLAEPARLVLARTADSASRPLRRAAFEVLSRVERDSRYPQTLRRFVLADPQLLEGETRAVLRDLDLSDAKLAAWIELTREACAGEGRADGMAALAAPMLRLLAAYGAAHPTRYRRLRAVLVGLSIRSGEVEVRRQAGEAADELQQGFRQWLGPSTRIAVDPETGREYGWNDVVAFDESVPEDDRGRLLSAIEGTALLREATFLFSRGTLIRLSDIPPAGVSIRLLGSLHGKSVYRTTIQTRFQGALDLAVNLNHSLTSKQVDEEIHWLIVSGDTGNHDPLVEEYGGYWADQDLWSEEFVAGETLARAMKRLSRREGASERYQQLWPFLAWTALRAYVDFWDRSGRRWEVADPSMTNVVVPTDDFQTGVRIVSISARRPHSGLLSMIRSFRDEFVAPAERQYPVLQGLVGWDVIFSSVLEIVGEDEGLVMLQAVLDEHGDEMTEDLRTGLQDYVKSVRVRGFLPRRLFFAAKRYRRWERLSTEPTPQARARTLQELYDTYGLARLNTMYPEARIRFFRETVFRGASSALAEGLEELISRIRSGELIGDDLVDAVSDLRARLDLGSDDDYFLARLSLPHLRPEDAADFVSGRLAGRPQSEIVVTLDDVEGRSFRVRHALTPKEVERLHRLFLASKLDVRFRPEHRYLVAINDRGQIVAGIYYDIEEDGHAAHLEKIVVAEPFRRKGVADGLMKEFFNRLRAAGVRTVTTGFFRPEYFYSYGFRIERRYAGLVKSLSDEE